MLIVFNDIAEHDVMWGEMCVDYVDPTEPDYLEPIMARGLVSITSILAAETYEEAYHLLYPDYPRSTDNLLYGALDLLWATDDGIALEDYTPGDESLTIPPPFFADPDAGPEEVWRWAHQDASRSQFINSPGKSQLDHLMIFDQPWEEPLPEAPSNDNLRRTEQRLSSIQRRGQICMGGGRGWWSFDDESRVVWPFGGGPRKKSTKPTPEDIRNMSLAEAKSFLLAMK